MQLQKGSMNVVERWEALLNRQPVDRVSYFPMGSPTFSFKNVGYTAFDFYTDAHKCFEAQRKTADQYGYFPFTYRAFGGGTAWKFGGKIRFPKSEYEMAPVVERYPVQSEEDVWRLKLPNVRTAGDIPYNMELSKLQESTPGMPITLAIASVFTVAGSIAGVENLCRWILKKPELAHHLVKLAGSLFLKLTKYWLDVFGPERIIIYSAGPTESNQVISSKLFENFVLPYQKQIHEKVLAMGVKHIFFHICGEQNENLPFWSKIPMGNPGIVSFGHEVDLETAARYFPNDIIVGNINPVTLQIGSSEEVYDLSRICIEKGKKALGGFMLAAGCSMSPLTPSYNYWVMQKALDDFGWYR